MPNGPLRDIDSQRRGPSRNPHLLRSFTSPDAATARVRGVDVTKRTVLIADDSSLMRAVLAAAIEADPDLVLAGEAVDGRQAIQLADGGCPDAIVVDNQMPQMTGIEAIPALRRRCPGSYIVLWSSDGDVEHRALEVGGDCFMSKSEPLERLLEQLKVA